MRTMISNLKSDLTSEAVVASEVYGPVLSCYHHSLFVMQVLQNVVSVCPPPPDSKGGGKFKSIQGADHLCCPGEERGSPSPPLPLRTLSERCTFPVEECRQEASEWSTFLGSPIHRVFITSWTQFWLTSSSEVPAINWTEYRKGTYG